MALSSRSDGRISKLWMAHSSTCRVGWNRDGYRIVDTSVMRLVLILMNVLAAFAVACGDGDTDPAPGDGSSTTVATPTGVGTPTGAASPPTRETPTPPASAPTDTPAATATGSLEGYVHIGPTCPVVREGEDCDDRPHEATMDIVDAGGAVIATVQSDATGRFSVTLAPGAYRLVPKIDGSFPSAGEQEFVIEAGRITQIDVAYDSGIR